MWKFVLVLLITPLAILIAELISDAGDPDSCRDVGAGDSATLVWRHSG